MADLWDESFVSKTDPGYGQYRQSHPKRGAFGMCRRVIRGPPTPSFFKGRDTPDTSPRPHLPGSAQPCNAPGPSPPSPGLR
eukprot:14504-Pelagomonas_calceolata.AAC.5